MELRGYVKAVSIKDKGLQAVCIKEGEVDKWFNLVPQGLCKKGDRISITFDEPKPNFRIFKSLVVEQESVTKNTQSPMDNRDDVRTELAIKKIAASLYPLVAKDGWVKEAFEALCMEIESAQWRKKAVDKTILGDYS